MKRIASLLMLAARSTLWKAAGDYSGLLSDGGGALPGCPVRLAGHRPHRLLQYSNPMGLRAC